MNPIRIYLYAKCSSCRNAEAVLEEAGVAFERRDIFKDRLSPSEIRALLAEIGKSAFDVLSTRSIPYRELELADKPVDEGTLISLMAEHPGLLKRPIIVAGDTVQIGFSRPALQALVAS